MVIMPSTWPSGISIRLNDPAQNPSYRYIKVLATVLRTGAALGLAGVVKNVVERVNESL